MTNPVARGFSNLTRFSGRDSRGQFWPYAGVVFALTVVLNAVGMMFVMSRFFGEIQTYAQTHPNAMVETAPDGYLIQDSAAMNAENMPMPDLHIFGGVMSGVILIAVCLYSAAVARRLHDRNVPAWWGLAPVPLLAIGMGGFFVLMNAVMAGTEPNFSVFGLLFVNNILYMGVLATLVIFLALPGTAGPNRYGPESQP